MLAVDYLPERWMLWLQSLAVLTIRQKQTSSACHAPRLEDQTSEAMGFSHHLSSSLTPAPPLVERWYVIMSVKKMKSWLSSTEVIFFVFFKMVFYFLASKVSFSLCLSTTCTLLWIVFVYIVCMPCLTLVFFLQLSASTMNCCQSVKDGVVCPSCCIPACICSH